MAWKSISKAPFSAARANLGDYEEICASFTWEAARRKLEGVPAADSRLLIDAESPCAINVEFDSMDFLNFLIGLHEATDVDIPEADYLRPSSLQAIADYFGQKRET